MIALKLLKPDNTWTSFGPDVKSLEEARILVHLLDYLTMVQQLPQYVDFYTRNTEVKAMDEETGESWDYHDQDPTGASDGVWEL